jgi:hypothetical protein
MPYSVLPISGVDLNGNTTVSFAYTNGTTAVSIPSFGPLGSQTFGSDGRRYVFARAGGTIAANATSVTINASTFAATSGGGSYISSAESMVSGDYGWFGVTSV